VQYLDSVEDVEQEDDQLRTIQEDAVQLLTFHGAKGLEWECVFLAGIAKQLIPTEKAPENPAEKWWRVPFELRGDHDFLPAQTKAGLEQLRNDEERRLMYVGITRAKQRLVLSRAWFYGANVRAKLPSVFWDEALPFADRLDEVDCPPVNPHPLGIEEPPAGPSGFVPLTKDPVEIARIEPELEHLRALESERPASIAWRPPSTLSVTAFLTFMRDPDQFFWRYVRPVPSPPSPAAQLGVELHRRIEQHARGAVRLGDSAEEAEEPYDLDPGERRTDGEVVSAEDLWENFRRSRFATMTPSMVEQPLTLYIGEGISIVGRIDAIFETDDDVWEIVDYKSGVSDPDPLQLAIYAKAVEEIWARKTVTTWLLLRSGEERTAPPVETLEQLLGNAAAALKEFR
jgi:ATP-dependent DNA helicase UvrD/PcrA